MTQVVIPGAQDRPFPDLRMLTHVMYGLHLLSWFSMGIFSVVAIIINYVKRNELPDAFYRSHFRWQARSFWFTLLWLAATSPLFLFFWVPGAAAWFVIGLWYLYRFIRGWLALVENRGMPVPMD
jgi:uncharacterized membrane protein